MKRGNALLSRLAGRLVPAELVALGVPLDDHQALRAWTIERHIHAPSTSRRQSGRPGCPPFPPAVLAVLIAAARQDAAGPALGAGPIADRFEVSVSSVDRAAENLRRALRKMASGIGADELEERRERLIAAAGALLTTQVERDLVDGRADLARYRRHA